MNAAIQFLRSIPEFDKLVRRSQITNVISMIIQPNSTEQRIASLLSGVLKELDGQDVTPKFFVSIFLGANPEFTPFGHQYDSD